MNKAEQEEFFGPKQKFSIQPRLALIIIAIIFVVAGFFIWNNFFKNKIKTQASATILNVPQEEIIANWKTYLNQQYKLSFKYPKEWTSKEQVNANALMSVVFVKTVTGEIDKSKFFRATIFSDINKLDSKNLKPASLKDYLDKYSLIGDPLYKNVTPQKIGNMNGYKVDMGPNQSGDGVAFFTEISNGQILTFRFFSGSLTDSEIQSLIASVKVTAVLAQIQTKTFSFKDLKFEFQYPKTWQDIWMSEIVQDSSKGNRGKAYSSLYKAGSTKAVYFDPDSFFGFKTYSVDYNGAPYAAVGPKKVDLTWTKEQFVENLKPSFDVLGYQKLGKNGVLVLDYATYECNPIFNANVYIPTENQTYPNLLINLNMGNVVFDQTVRDYVAIQAKAGKSTCDTKKPFQLIADKILAGTYSSKMKSQIEIAKQIADSFKNLN